MTLEVSHLVVNGCSLTYCQGLDKPNEQGWPALLGKKLGVPVVNLAIGGSSNDAIFRKTAEYVHKNLVTNSKPFFIVAFSGALRREIFLKSYKFHDDSSNYLIDFASSSVDYLCSLLDLPENIDELNYKYIIDLSFFAAERSKLLNWVSTINLFKAHNISYFTTDYLPTSDEKIMKMITDNYKELNDYIHKDYQRLQDFYTLTSHLKKLPCNHDGYEAQEVIANYVYNQLISRYSTIISVPAQYLELQEFYSESYKKMTKHLENLWL